MHIDSGRVGRNFDFTHGTSDSFRVRSGGSLFGGDFGVVGSVYGQGWKGSDFRVGDTF